MEMWLPTLSVVTGGVRHEAEREFLKELFLGNLIYWKIMSEWQVSPIEKSKVQKKPAAYK